MEWFIMALKRYADFSGRSRRKEYWFFYLFYVLIFIGIQFLEVMLNMSEPESFGLFSGLFFLGMFIPSIAVTVRRLHDTNRSGWWILISFVPLIGFIAMLFFLFSEGDSGSNAYGPDPKANVAEAGQSSGASEEEFWTRRDV